LVREEGGLIILKIGKGGEKTNLAGCGNTGSAWSVCGAALELDLLVCLAWYGVLLMKELVAFIMFWGYCNHSSSETLFCHGDVV